MWVLEFVHRRTWPQGKQPAVELASKRCFASAQAPMKEAISFEQCCISILFTTSRKNALWLHSRSESHGGKIMGKLFRLRESECWCYFLFSFCVEFFHIASRSPIPTRVEQTTPKCAVCQCDVFSDHSSAVCPLLSMHAFVDFT